MSRAKISDSDIFTQINDFTGRTIDVNNHQTTNDTKLLHFASAVDLNNALKSSELMNNKDNHSSICSLTEPQGRKPQSVNEQQQKIFRRNFRSNDKLILSPLSPSASNRLTKIRFRCPSVDLVVSPSTASAYSSEDCAEVSIGSWDDSPLDDDLYFAEANEIPLSYCAMEEPYEKRETATEVESSGAAGSIMKKPMNGHVGSDLFDTDISKVQKMDDERRRSSQMDLDDNDVRRESVKEEADGEEQSKEHDDENEQQIEEQTEAEEEQIQEEEGQQNDEDRSRRTSAASKQEESNETNEQTTVEDESGEHDTHDEQENEYKIESGNEERGKDSGPIEEETSEAHEPNETDRHSTSEGNNQEPEETVVKTADLGEDSKENEEKENVEEENEKKVEEDNVEEENERKEEENIETVEEHQEEEVAEEQQTTDLQENEQQVIEEQEAVKENNVADESEPAEEEVQAKIITNDAQEAKEPELVETISEEPASPTKKKKKSAAAKSTPKQATSPIKRSSTSPRHVGGPPMRGRPWGAPKAPAAPAADVRLNQSWNSSSVRRTQSQSPGRPHSDKGGNLKTIDIHSIFSKSEKDVERRRRLDEEAQKKKAEEEEKQQIEKEQKRKEAEAAYQAWLRRKAQERRRAQSTGRGSVSNEQTQEEAQKERSRAEAESAFQAWLERKKEEQKERKRQLASGGKSQQQSPPAREDANEAFRSWKEQKDQQRREERMLIRAQMREMQSIVPIDSLGNSTRSLRNNVNYNVYLQNGLPKLNHHIRMISPAGRKRVTRADSLPSISPDGGVKVM